MRSRSTQAARRALTEELGIEPSRELRERQQAVLRQDAALDSRPHQQGGARALRWRVRRTRARARRAGRCPRGRAGGRGRLVLLAASPASARAGSPTGWSERPERSGRAGDRRSLLGGGRRPCLLAVGSGACAPTFARPISTRSESSSAPAPGISPSSCRSCASCFELREPPAMESEGARFRLFEAASSFLRSAAHARPIVLVLDDLHAADEPSLLLLRFVAREIADSRLLWFARSAMSTRRCATRSPRRWPNWYESHWPPRSG